MLKHHRNAHRERLRQLRYEFAKAAEERALKELLAEAAYHAQIVRDMAGKNPQQKLLTLTGIIRSQKRLLM